MRFAIYVSWAGTTFVKEYNFFVSQGGLSQAWGKRWKIVEANSLENARIMALKMPGANDSVYCIKCGKSKYECKETKI